MVVVSLCVACAGPPLDATPEGAVRAFVEAMDGVHGDEGASAAALRLLSRDTRQALEARAARASSVSGAQLTAGDMLVPSQFWQSFEPTSYASRLRGDRAWVTVSGGPGTAVASGEIPCVREEGRWRVELPVPPLAPLRQREPAAGVELTPRR